MTIRPIAYDSNAKDGGPDVALAARLMSGVPNPPYWDSPHALAEYLTDPKISAFVNDGAEQLVVLMITPKRQEVQLVWGLPLPVKTTMVDGKPVVSLRTTTAARDKLTGLRAVARAAELDILARYPEARNWRYWGRFQTMGADGRTLTTDGGRALCYGWKEYGYSSSHIGPDGDGHFSMWTTVAEALADGRP